MDQNAINVISEALPAVAACTLIAKDVAIAIIRETKGCNHDEAVQIIKKALRDFFGSQNKYRIENDLDAADKIIRATKLHLGEKEYSDLCEKLSIEHDHATPFYPYEHDGLPVLAIAVPKDSDVNGLEQSVKAIIKNALQKNGVWSPKVFCIKKYFSKDLILIDIRYAYTPDEERLIKKAFENERSNTSYNPPDTGDDDIYE